jgi:probable rRNA maturation factor
VADGRGRATPDDGLAAWLARVAPASLRGDVAVALVSDVRMRSLNRQFRDADYATDVLSFPAHEPPEPRNLGTKNPRTPKPRNPITEPRNRGTQEPRNPALGDIVIATGVARRQARHLGHSVATELRVLALHGLLHLAGYDHERPDDDGRMRRVEDRLRRRGGLPTGLMGRAGSTTGEGQRRRRP